MSAWFVMHLNGTVTVGGEGSPTLEEKQEAVNGYIELISLPSGNRMWANEDGIPLELPANPYASALLWDCSPHHFTQYLYGTVVMEYTGDEVDVEEASAHIMKYDNTVDVIDMTEDISKSLMLKDDLLLPTAPTGSCRYCNDDHNCPSWPDCGGSEVIE